jgi:hypothetical protein
VNAYLLRNVPDELWIRVKRQAAKEGRPLRFVVIRLLELYAQHGLNGLTHKLTHRSKT